ncbi:thiolase family protein [Lutimaribacter marinistellae]|uniref:Thiolase family protein n=1 Tax=Lutimaribacter marinistellae TaxID=1820329 RepID=A0ABV7TDQ5_9RHOB
MAQEIVIAAGTRTAMGNYGGSLKGVELTDMAGHAARACVAKSGIAPEKIDHMVFTTTVPTDRDTLFAARVVGVKSGIPEDAGALHVVRACASGLQSIISAGQQVDSGHSRLALAGGAECYSRAPHAMAGARWGTPRGPIEMEDMLDWAYRCPFSQEYMGETAENLAEEYQYEREPMDEWGAMSQARAIAAIESGFLARQITPIEVSEGKGTRVFDTDESPRADATMEKLSRLKPAFRAGGKVTAGNSSGVTDGSGFVIVGDRAAMEAEGCAPEARLVDWHCVGVPARIMGHGPVPAIKGLLEKTGLSVSDIDYFEINEAFAVVNLHAERHLGIPRDIHNLYGGGISIGHPPGLTGVRMTMTAVEHLKETGGKRAILSMCLGAGQGLAMLIERVA